MAIGKEVILLAKKDCGCGCVPPGKTAKPSVKKEPVKSQKKPAK